MGDFFTVSVIVATLASGIRLATPFLLAGLGERAIQYGNGCAKEAQQQNADGDEESAA